MDRNWISILNLESTVCLCAEKEMNFIEKEFVLIFIYNAKIEPAFLCLLYKIELYTKPNQDPRAHEARFSRYVIYI